MLYLHTVSLSIKLPNKNTLYSTDHYISSSDEISFYSEYDHTEITKVKVRNISKIDSETLTNFGTAFELPENTISLEVNGYNE